MDDERTPAMYGRDETLARAQRPLSEALAGRGRLVLLAGEAGIGKTRLLRAVQEEAAAQGFARWSAAASPQDLELSGGLLLDLGHAMARSTDTDVADRGTALLADLLDVTGHSAPSGDAHRRRRLVVLDAVERLASLAEQGPALLALEDLHWCDELSLEIVGQLARRLPSLSLCVVGTLRTDELHQEAPARSWRARMLLQRLAVELRLSPLDREQCEAMVRDLLGGAVPPGAWSSWSTSGRAGFRCMSRSWSAPPRRGT
ncbi:MAG: ATP-binding protein [Nocardioides sp.]